MRSGVHFLPYDNINAEDNELYFNYKELNKETPCEIPNWSNRKTEYRRIIKRLKLL